MRRLLRPGIPVLPFATASLAALAMGWVAVPVAQDQLVADGFLAVHQAAVALNRPGADLQIRFKGERTTFNPREPIAIELVFDLDPGHGVLGSMPEDPCRGWPLAEVVIDRPDGVSAPQTHLCRDLAERMPGGVLSGVPGGLLSGVGGPRSRSHRR